MLYLFESELIGSKPVNYALRSIYGLGKKKSDFICKNLGFSNNFKVNNLSKDQVNRLIKFIETLDMDLGSELKQIRLFAAKNLTLIRSYRGIRRSQGLPVRGQRTHTNARIARKGRF
jgi:small subunit ribosomal protein S13